MASSKVEQELESGPGTEAFVPDFDDGEPSVPFVPDFDTDSQAFVALAGLQDPEPEPTETVREPDAPEDEPEDGPEVPPGPVAVPGRYVYLKWWKLILVLFGVWSIAAVFGLSLYYWWYHDLDKTPSVLVVFGYVVVCTVAGLILAMVESKPLIAALAIAVLSAPFASVGAAAPLYGYFYCERVATPCLMGVVPQ